MSKKQNKAAAREAAAAAQADARQLEKRRGRAAGAAAGAAVTLLLAALIAANIGSTKSGATSTREVGGSDTDRLHELVDYHGPASAQVVSMCLRVVGVLLTVGVGVYLYWLVQRRGSPRQPLVLAAAVLGPILLAVATVYGFVALHQVAVDFYASGARSASRAGDLVTHSSRLKTAGIVDTASRVVFGAWIGLLSLYALRVGLLTTFLGYWGIATGVALIVIPQGDALFIGWLASIAFLASGYWPGGRPEAWDRPMGASGAAATL